nr:crm-domain containing factor cfm2, chloroplastic [Quercus suber]
MSWSTPENPVPVLSTGFAITKYHQLRREVIKQKVMHKKEKKAPTLAELSLSEAELRRLRRLGIETRKKLKVGKARIIEGIVNGIYEVAYSVRTKRLPAVNLRFFVCISSLKMLYLISLHLLSHFSSQTPKPPTTLELTSSILAQLRRCHGFFECHLPHSSSLKPKPQRVATPPSSCLVLEIEPRNPKSLLCSSRLIDGGSQTPKPPTTLELTSSILAQLRRCHGFFERHLPHSSSLKPKPQRVATPPSSCLVLEIEPRNPTSLLCSSRLIDGG